VEQFFSKTVSIVVTSREPPPLYTSTSTSQISHENTPIETSQETPSKRLATKTDAYKFRSRPQPIESPEKDTKPIDILLRARNLHIKIWTSDSTLPLSLSKYRIQKDPSRTIKSNDNPHNNQPTAPLRRPQSRKTDRKNNRNRPLRPPRRIRLLPRPIHNSKRPSPSPQTNHGPRIP
jgi:hypothetical protein